MHRNDSSPERTLRLAASVHKRDGLGGGGAAAAIEGSSASGGYLLFVCDRPLTWALTVAGMAALALVGVAALTTTGHMQGALRCVPAPSPELEVKRLLL